MIDLLILGGTIVDGTGREPYRGDIGIEDGKIVAIGEVGCAGEQAAEVIDAAGLHVTPGFVDIHTHYDGQISWDPLLTPSCWHGVTTAIIGNCGVGFAPVAGDAHQWLIELLAGVEDIPAEVLSEAMVWGWESFPEYMDFLAEKPRVMDVGTQVPHSALRTYVMGSRGASDEEPTRAELSRMSGLVKEAIEAGALGFTTSRTTTHRALNGDPVPGTFASESELIGITEALAELGEGMIGVSPAGVAGEDDASTHKELDWMIRLSQQTGRPVCFNLTQGPGNPGLFREALSRAAEAVGQGADVYAQVAGRPVGLLMGLETTYHPFLDRPSFAALHPLPVEEKVEKLRDPELRAKILSEEQSYEGSYEGMIFARFDRMIPIRDETHYEPGYEESLAGIAEREGRSSSEVLYDFMLEEGGRRLLLFPILNFADGNCDAIREMLIHPRSVLGLADGGAHLATICDSSISTFMLTHWARDRQRGEKLPLEEVIKQQTLDTARLYGLEDRGTLALGMKADINVIDMDRLRLCPPEVAYDLPKGGRRIIQRAEGYAATLVSGVVTFRDGKETGTRPGQIIRGAQSAP
ncbi:MAG: amidohydrolase family protein [bacterium]|nr:amidohydrolase [Deltaproteobacteria bacterium]MCP4908121.1 amidohydrolase family protein [bacterium]